MSKILFRDFLAKCFGVLTKVFCLQARCKYVRCYHLSFLIHYW
jgi:hypothetical protein